MLCQRSPPAFNSHSATVKAGETGAVTGPPYLLENCSTSSSYVAIDDIYSGNNSSNASSHETKSCFEAGMSQEQQLQQQFRFPSSICAGGNNQQEQQQEQVNLSRGEFDPSISKGKRIQHVSSDTEDELIKALGALSLDKDYWTQTALQVHSADPLERYEGTKRFRMLLSVSGEIPIQAVIDTGVVPKLIEFISEDYDGNPLQQFEAAWALTNIASGTETQTEVNKIIKKKCNYLLFMIMHYK